MMGPLWRVKEPEEVVELWVAPVATGPVQITALSPLAVVAFPPLAQRVEPGGAGGGAGALSSSSPNPNQPSRFVAGGASDSLHLR